VLPSLKKPWIRPPIVCIEWTESPVGLKSITALLVDSVPKPYFLEKREEDEGLDEDDDDVSERAGVSDAGASELERIRGEAGLASENGSGNGFGEVKVDGEDDVREEDSSDDEYDGSYSKGGPYHVFDRAIGEGYGGRLAVTERTASGQLASTSGSENQLTWKQSEPDSYYLCLGSDNSWYVVSNQAITSVHPGPKGEAPLEPGEDPRAVLKARLKAAGSQNWVNLGGSKVDVWCVISMFIDSLVENIIFVSLHCSRFS
jgi:hypothetical protein